MDLDEAINIFQGSDKYSEYINSYCEIPSIDSSEIRENEITKSIFFHLYKARLAEWEMRRRFKRYLKHQMSGYLQDMVAFYLKSYLGDNYEVLVEKAETDVDEEGKKRKYYPDISIKQKDDYIALIEIKTNMGYMRNKIKKADSGVEDICGRVNKLSEVFGVRRNNVYYIIEIPGNVNKTFEANFWDKENYIPKNPPQEEPYNYIRPLFHIPVDPYYWNKYLWKGKNLDETKTFNKAKDLSKDDKLKIAEANIIRKIEDTFREIKSI